MNKTEWGGFTFAALLLVFITASMLASETMSPQDTNQTTLPMQQTGREGSSAGQPPLQKQRPAKIEKSTGSIDEAWDRAFAEPAMAPDPALTPQTPVSTGGNFEERVFVRYAVEYRREEMSYTNRPTVTNVARFGGIDPSGRTIRPLPSAFKPNDGQLYSDISFGTRAFAAERYNVYFSMRYRHDLDDTTLGSPFAGILDTFRARRRAEVYNGYVDVGRLGSSGLWSQTSLRFGRQSFFGAEPVDLDGATLTFNNNTRYDVSVFAGRRFTYWSDPFSRFIVGADFGFKFSPSARFRYQHTYYVRNTHRFSYQHTYRTWTFDTFFKMLNRHPIDFSAGINYSASSGAHWVYANFFQKITNRDFFFDYVGSARTRNQIYPQFFTPRFLDDRNIAAQSFTDRNLADQLFVDPNLRLGTIPKYSQFYIEAHRKLNPILGIGGTFWLRRLNNERDQTAFLNSFEEATVRFQISPLRSFEVLPQYRFRNIRRQDPDVRAPCRADPPQVEVVTFGPCHFDVRGIGERRLHEILADTSFALSSKISFGVGGFFRSYDTQGSFNRFDARVDERRTIANGRTVATITRSTFGINSQNTGGILAHVKYRLDPHSSVRFEYGNDKDFSIFYPDIDRIQAFRVRYEYNR